MLLFILLDIDIVSVWLARRIASVHQEISTHTRSIPMSKPTYNGEDFLIYADDAHSLHSTHTRHIRHYSTKRKLLIEFLLSLDITKFVLTEQIICKFLFDMELYLM